MNLSILYLSSELIVIYTQTVNRPGGTSPSKANMSLSNLPPELLGLILTNILPDEWNCYYSGFKVLNLRIICRKYSKRVF
jgi:hypothetical protein